MRLKAVILENFRSYRHKTRIEFGDMTAFIGRNDAGKSTVLEALAIFFDTGVVKLDRDDANAYSGNSVVTIGCVFDVLPDELVIDVSAETTLAQEYLVNAEGCFEIHKRYDVSASRISTRVSAVANHPTVTRGNDLLHLKNSDLKARAKDLGVDNLVDDLRSNPSLRKVIWEHFKQKGELQLEEQSIALDREAAKDIWDNFSKLMPMFALFRADRPSTDADAEAQDPMKAAVKEAIQSVAGELAAIKNSVEEQVKQVAYRTLEKLREMDATLANELKPVLEEPKWDGFKLSLVGDDNIPVNKRGSGVRRLILLNFFRAEAERKAQTDNREGVIYAIEEPEVSQHPDHIRMLLKALIEISQMPDHQVLLTTHVPSLAGLLPLDTIRYLSHDKHRNPVVSSGTPEVFKQVVEALGVLPDIDSRAADGRLKLLVCVEGPHDVRFLQHVCRLLRTRHETIPDIVNDPQIAVIPLYGEHLKNWVDNNWLRGRGIVEFHLYDKDDDSKYAEYSEAVNGRGDGSYACLTQRLSIESYVHPRAVCEALNVTCELETLREKDYDLPRVVVDYLRENKKHQLWKPIHDSNPREWRRKIKPYIHDHAVPLMTLEMLEEIDPDNDILSWFRQMAQMLT